MVFTQSSHVFTVFCHVAMAWACFSRPLEPFRQIPRNAIMCSTLLRAAPAVLPSKCLDLGHPESWESESWQMMMESLMEVWNHGISWLFFCQKKRAEFGNRLICCFLFVFDSRCSGAMWFSPFLTTCGFLRGGHVKGSETWHHRIQCVSLDDFLEKVRRL